MKKQYLAMSLLFVIGLVFAQSTVFSDDFSLNQSTSWTTNGQIGSSAFYINRSGDDWGGRRNTSPAQLELTNDVGTTANVTGWVFANASTSGFSSPYNTTLSSNPGLVTWYCNIRQIRPDPSGYGSGAYGAAYILGATNQSAFNNGTGYAIVYGQSGATDPIRLAKYSAGITSGLTNIITSNTTGLTDFGADYVSCKVTYDPSSNTWELFLRNDGTSAFTDPTSGTLVSQGTAVDATYTSTSLSYMGCYWQGGTAATQPAFFDNVIVQVTQASTPTINVNPSSLTGFTYVYGSGPSSEKTFTLTGSNLTANLAVSVTSNYEIASSSGGTFGSSLSYTPSSGSVSATVYVRQVAGLAIGSSYTGTVTCSSTGADNKTVSLNGEVTTPPPPNPPVASDETDVGSDAFTANWNSVSGATGYDLDVYYMSAGTNATDLLISEYVEGSSSNKYIEIYNGTGNSVDLTYYYLQLYSNGATTPTQNIQLSGTLTNGATIVYKNSAAALTLPDGVTAITNAAVNYNGDDAVALYYNDGAKAAYYVDIFGRIGEQPSTAWTSGSHSTAEQTLVRKSAVTGGITTNPTNGFPTLESEWDTYAQNTATYLGSHTFTGGSSLVYVTGYEDLDVGNVTSYEVTGLDPATTYYYRVRAYNAYGTSENSDEEEVTTDDEPLPVVLSSFTASISAQNYVTLTWVTQTETGMLGYYVYRATDGQLATAELVSPMVGASNSSTAQTYVYSDSEIFNSGTYYYWLESVDFDGNNHFFGPVSIIYDVTGEYYNPEIPLVTELRSIYPNPFNPIAYIPFSLGASRDVSFKIYNNRGQIVREFNIGEKLPGEYRLEWDGRDNNGQALSSGVYYIRMTAGKDSFQRKAVLMK